MSSSDSELEADSFLSIQALFFSLFNSIYAMVVSVDLFASGSELKLSIGWILSKLNLLFECLISLEAAYPSVWNLCVVDPLELDIVPCR